MLAETITTSRLILDVRKAKPKNWSDLARVAHHVCARCDVELKEIDTEMGRARRLRRSASQQQQSRIDELKRLKTYHNGMAWRAELVEFGALAAYADGRPWSKKFSASRLVQRAMCIGDLVERMAKAVQRSQKVLSGERSVDLYDKDGGLLIYDGYLGAAMMYDRYRVSPDAMIVTLNHCLELSLSPELESIIRAVMATNLKLYGGIDNQKRPRKHQAFRKLSHELRRTNDGLERRLPWMRLLMPAFG